MKGQGRYFWSTSCPSDSFTDLWTSCSDFDSLWLPGLKWAVYPSFSDACSESRVPCYSYDARESFQCCTSLWLKSGHARASRLEIEAPWIAWELRLAECYPSVFYQVITIAEGEIYCYSHPWLYPHQKRIHHFLEVDTHQIFVSFLYSAFSSILILVLFRMAKAGQKMENLA